MTIEFIAETLLTDLYGTRIFAQLSPIIFERFYALLFSSAWSSLSKAATNPPSKPCGGVCKKSVLGSLSPLMRLRQGDFCI